MRHPRREPPGTESADARRALSATPGTGSAEKVGCSGLSAVTSGRRRSPEPCPAVVLARARRIAGPCRRRRAAVPRRLRLGRGAATSASRVLHALGLPDHLAAADRAARDRAASPCGAFWSDGCAGCCRPPCWRWPASCCSAPPSPTPTSSATCAATCSRALGYVANWRFVFADQSYADLFAAPSPVQHFWSLAIEEQFYLCFPIVAALAFVALRAADVPNRARRTGRGFGGGRALARDRGCVTRPSVLRHRYTRAFELVVGALLACAFVPARSAPLASRPAHAAAHRRPRARGDAVSLDDAGPIRSLAPSRRAVGSRRCWPRPWWRPRFRRADRSARVAQSRVTSASGPHQLRRVRLPLADLPLARCGSNGPVASPAVLCPSGGDGCTVGVFVPLARAAGP